MEKKDYYRLSREQGILQDQVFIGHYHEVVKKNL